MKQKIAIIGTNEQQNPLILRAKEMGFETHVFAWQTGGEIGEKTADFFYPISANNKEEILAKCKEIGVCAIASIGSDMAAISASYVADNLHLTSNTYSSTICATNKILSREIFEKCGIRQPRFVDISDAIPSSIKDLQYPLVVKPSDRSGGRGLKKVESSKQLYSAINNAREISFERKAIVEEYIDGQLYSCECISFNGNHTILGYTKRSVINIAGRLCENGHQQPSNVPTSIKGKMESICPKVLNALGLRYGASSIEFIVDNDHEVYIIEVTPSMYGDYIGTDLIPATTGYDYTGMVIDVACGKAPDISKKGTLQKASVRFFYSAADADANSQIRDIPENPDGERYGHIIRKEPLKAFGGCKPLYVSERQPYYSGENVVPVNSEYTAFWLALKDAGVNRLHIPYYISPSWERILEKLQIEPVYYHIGQDFIPTDLEETDETVLLINYNAGCGKYIEDYAAKHSSVMIDNSMAFYTKPIIRDGVYNIYSSRKFFAVPDGGYLIASGMREHELEADVSYKRARTLLLSLEQGEKAAYKEQMTNEQELNDAYRAMSSLTSKLLSSIDYEKAKEARLMNYQTLEKFLSRFNQVPHFVSEGSVPQFYPLLVNVDIRNALIANNIFVPVMWRKLISEQYEGTYEKLFSEKMLFLPIDQQYSVSDMEYMAQTITALLT